MASLLDGASKGGQQYIRKIDLVVFGTDLNGLDLSNLRIKFAVKRSSSMTPNMADIRIYNLELQTALRIRNEFKRVILQAGYASNYGVIFQGNIKQVILGRESATDTFVDIIAGDGDQAFNYAIVNKTIAAGATRLDQINAAAAPMASKGVTQGTIGDMPKEQLPRGKVMYGNSRDYLRDVAQSSDKSWSVQDEKITFVSNKAYLPGERVVLTSDTGMIGTPQQTTQGVNVKCLLNPNLKVNTRVAIDNSSIESLKINLNVTDPKQLAASIPANLSSDGTYYILVIEHTGDTRDVEWYSSLVCLNIDITTFPAESVQTNYGE